MSKFFEIPLAYQELKSPVTVQSELTFRCPNECVYCYNYWKKEEEPNASESELDLKNWLIIAKNLVDSEIFNIVLTGGEPLERRDIVYPLAKYFLSNGIDVKINSSLVPITTDDCKKIKDNGIRAILAGFPSAVKKSYNRITRSENYIKAIRGIEAVLKYDIPIAVNMVVNKLNRNEVYKTGTFFHSLGINSFAATPAIPCTFMRRNLELTNAEIAETLDSLINLREDYNMNVDIVEAIPRCSIDDPVRYEKFLRRDCGAGRTAIAVSPSGKARPCTHSSLNYGSLIQENVQVIWKRMVDWRGKAFIPTSCMNQCNESSLCSFGCREAAKYRMGSYSALDPRADPQNMKNARSVISRVKNIDPETKFCFVEDLRYRKEEKGYLIFSPKSNTLVYVNPKLFDFIGILLKHEPFSVMSIQEELRNSKVFAIINYLNMKGVLKKWQEN